MVHQVIHSTFKKMEELRRTNRREFIGQSLKTIGLISLAGIPSSLLGSELHELTILHTNDTHSRIDPFPDNDPKYAGLGGVARRSEIINSIRKSKANVLLLDSGDIFQGTPYFNLFGGEVELKAMTAMGYDCATFGNHDFDNGIEGLVSKMPFAGFPFVNVNYRLNDTSLFEKTNQFRIFEKGKIKVGVFGVGIDLNGLVDSKLTEGLVYTDPISSANRTAEILRHDHRCHLVICLSHLGYKYDNSQISDITLAMNTKNIDLILGGHTHTFLDQPDIVKNSEQKNVIIAQTGFGGIRLGRIDFLFGERGQKISHSHSTVKVS